jgi:N-acetylneuraminic acid mutarotase
MNDYRFTRINCGEYCPSPRANHAACYHEGKIYMFGGNGGKTYENSVFKDLWVFTPSTKKWEEIKFNTEGKFFLI